MISLVMMYVFYDKNGDIKAITPNLDEHFSTIFSSATFPLSEVEPFLRVEKNSFDYQVKKYETLSGTTYKLVKKASKIVFTRTLDNYLTKVEDVDKSHSTVIITNIVYDKVISVELSKQFKEFAHSSNEDEQELVQDFLSKGPSTVYLTAKDNPFYLLFNFTFTPQQLFDAEKLYFNYDDVYTNTSVYTKKLIAGYGFKEKVS